MRNNKFPLICFFLTIVAGSISCNLFVHENLVGYINNLGNYGLNYPKSWEAFEIGPSVVFEFEDGKVEISVQPTNPGQTLETIRTEFMPTYFDSDFSNLVISSEPGLKNNHLDRNGEIIGRTYFIIHHNFLYSIALYADVDDPLPRNFPGILKQFDDLIESFRFLD